MVYIDTRTVGRLAHYLLDSLRTAEIDGIVLTFTQDAGKDVIQTIGKFADVVVHG
jgi:hypothetical protein